MRELPLERHWFERQWGHVSQRRACRLVGVDPKTVRRERSPDCAGIRKEMQEIAGKRRRFGYRRIGVLLERKGMSMNHIAAGPGKDPGDRFPGGALYRIYREEGPSVKRRRCRKRARGTRTPIPVAALPNARPLSRFAGKPLPVSGIVGLRIRQLRRLAEGPDPGRDRRLHARMPVPRGGHQPVRHTGCP